MALENPKPEGNSQEASGYYLLNLGTHLNVRIGKKEGVDHGFEVSKRGDWETGRGLLPKWEPRASYRRGEEFSVLPSLLQQNLSLNSKQSVLLKKIFYYIKCSKKSNIVSRHKD